MAVRPPALRRGDVVGVVAPSSPVPPALLDSGVEQLRAWGLDVRLGRHVLDHDHADILAGCDEDRAADLRAFWTDPQVRGVICARGGYGAARVLDHLDWDQLRAVEPKALVGSSDVTALHQAFATHLGLTTLFAPMVTSGVFADPDQRDPDAVEALRACLFGEDGPDHSPVRMIGDGPVLGPTAAVDGPVVGGTLTLLCSLIGTPHLALPRDGLAVLEDVGEEPYRVDRMLTQLRHSGWFHGVRGIAVGSFWECGDVAPVLADRLGDLGVPVVCGFGFGHGDRQATVPLGVPAVLDPRDRTLRFTESALAPRR